MTSQLASKLRGKEFVVTAELSPPVATDPAAFIKRALFLRGLASAVNVTDGAGARARLSALVAAHFLLANQIEPVLQMTCRDRNRIALQADLMGAAALGLHNILILTGDDPKAGDQPETKPVFDLDSRGLLAMANRMRRDHRLPSGAAISGPIEFFLGAADTPLDPPPDWRPTTLAAKVEAGAEFVQTQFCMDIAVVSNYAARLLDCGLAQRVALLIGVAPIPSARAARWMREKLPGTLISDAIVARLEKAANPKQEGRRICVELLQLLAEVPGIAGAHVMAPQNPAAIPDVIAAAGVTGKKRAAV